MEEEKQSIWHRELNLGFVYAVVFLSGLLIVYIMTNVLNAKLEEINNATYAPVEQNM